MCWNFEASIIGWMFSTAVALFVVNSRKSGPQLRFGAAALLGVCSMQFAEAVIHVSEDVDTFYGAGMCKLGGLNRFGTQVLVPTALIFQPLGGFFGTLFYDSASMRSWHWLYVLVPLWVNGGDPVKYFLYGDNSTINFPPFMYYFTGDGAILCSWRTPMGYLAWRPSDDLRGLLLWFAYVSLWVLWFYRPVWKAVGIISYGLLALWTSWTLTDSPGSNWCFYITGYAFLGLMDYYFQTADDVKKAQ